MNTDAPFTIIGEARPSAWLVTCDHATNRVPPCVGDGSLGLSQADMARHIAFDPGTAGLSRALAEALNAPAILSNFSRLVIDPNRGEEDPTLLMRLYDGTIIPANRHADAAEKERRLEAFHRPYHRALEILAAQRTDRAICSLHSFTPQLKGQPKRPWQVGILSAYDKRLTDPLIEALRADRALAREVEGETGEPWCVGDNEPYIGHFPGDSIDHHALQHGRPNILIELRQDLIASPADQTKWAARLAPHIGAVLANTSL